MASSQYLSHIYNISCLSVPKKESFCQRDLAFLKLDFLAMTKIHIICGCGNVQTVLFRKNWKIAQTFLFKSAVSASAALSLSSICWQVGPDPMICVARQGPESGSNLTKYLSPWGLFKCRLKAIAWCDISHSYQTGSLSPDHTGLIWVGYGHSWISIKFPRTHEMASVSPLCQLQENTSGWSNVTFGWQEAELLQDECFVFGGCGTFHMSQVALQPDLLFLWAMALKVST